MARPSPSIPTRQLVFLLQAIVEWAPAHATALALELGELKISERAAEIADQLARAEGTLAQERKEDKDVTTRRDATIAKGITFYRGLQSSVALALRAIPNANTITADFHFKPPSSLRGLAPLSAALQQVTTALQLHAAALQGVARYPDWVEHTARLHGALDQLAKAAARESLETREAQDARDSLRTQALNLLEDIYLASEAAVIDQADTLNSLNDLIRAYTRV